MHQELEEIKKKIEEKEKHLKQKRVELRKLGGKRIEEQSEEDVPAANYYERKKIQDEIDKLRKEWQELRDERNKLKRQNR